jgi:hypothetical protein
MESLPAVLGVKWESQRLRRGTAFLESAASSAAISIHEKGYHKGDND